MVETEIRDAGGTGNKALVTEFGQLVVGPIAYSSSATQKLELNDTAYNFIAPKKGKNIVITDILLYANRSVGVNDATVEIYEADAVDELIVSDTIIKTEMVKQTSRDLTGLNLITKGGKWINAKTDDDDVFVTIMFYYIPV